MRVRDAIAHMFGSLLGRRSFARLARFLWLRSRLDVPNNLQTNGERDVQEAVLRRVREKGRGTIFDVGANVGQWTSSLVAVADRVGIPDGGLELHLFEPSPEAAPALEVLIEKFPPNVSAVLNRVAVAGESGRRTFHVMGPTAGTNSLYESPEAAGGAIEVPCITLDRYCRENQIERVDLCKIDAEGADFRILEGGIESLQADILACVQFEYNHRWVYSRRFLRDVFDMVAPLGRQVGKVTPWGVETYDEWDPELETFREGNYLISEGLPDLGITTFPWWKDCRG